MTRLDYLTAPKNKWVYLIPNLLTSVNIFFGVFAMISAFNAEYGMAAVAILIAGVMDNVDGKIARMTKTTSRFGGEYDSLSDLVSFGVAPGLLIYAWSVNAYGRLGWVAVCLYIACGALRLARYNVQGDGTEHADFVGLPIPAAASFIATSVILDNYILHFGREIRPIFILVITFVLAFLMVSRIRYRSPKNIHFRTRSLGWILFASIVFAIFKSPQVVPFLIVVLYILSGLIERPLVALYCRYYRAERKSGGRGDEEKEKKFLLGHP